MHKTRPAIFSLLALCSLAACSSDEASKQEEASSASTQLRPQPVVVYSSVAATQIKPALAAFTAETGIKVTLIVEEYSRLVAKIENHGSDPMADLLLAAGVTDLSNAAQNDILRPTFNTSQSGQVAENLLDPENFWHPLGLRARVVVYNTNLVSDDELATISDYSSLRDEIWHERLCVSSAKVPGNRLIIAALIREHGERNAELIVRGWLANSGARFYSDDAALLQAVRASECHIAIADTSVLAAFINADRDVPLVAHRFADDSLLQVDVSGAGVTRHAQNPDGAVALLQWLRTTKPNALFAASGFEFPSNKAAPVSSSLIPWSGFVANPGQISQLAFIQEEAALLAERARYP